MDRLQHRVVLITGVNAKTEPGRHQHVWMLVTVSHCHDYYGLAAETSFPAQFSSVAQSCPTLCDPMDCSTPGFPVQHQLPEIAQTHVHRVGDATQPSHPLLRPISPAFSLSQHQGIFLQVSSSHQVAKVFDASASVLVLPMDIQD